MSHRVVLEFDSEEGLANFLHWARIAGFVTRDNDLTGRPEIDMPDFKPRRKRKKK